MSLFRNLLIEKEMTLPSIYRKVKSLQSDGTAYINTGFVIPEDGATFEIDFTCKKWLTQNTIYGSRSQTSPYPGYLLYLYGNLRLTSMLAGTLMRAVYGDEDPAPQLTLNGVYNVRTSYYKNGNSFGFSESINGEPTVYKTGIATTYVQPGDCPLFIFASNNGDTPNNVSSSVDVHSFKISTNDEQKIMDLIPCVRKADNVPGFFDKVGRKFLTNAASSGSFIIE